MRKGTSGNSGFAKWGVIYFYHTFVLKLNIRASNRLLWVKSPTSQSRKPLAAMLRASILRSNMTDK